MSQEGTKIEISLIGETEELNKAVADINALAKEIATRKGIEYCQDFKEDFPL